MKTMTCVHPVRMVNTMRKFAESVGLTCSGSRYLQFVDGKFVPLAVDNQPITYCFHHSPARGFSVCSANVDIDGCCYINHCVEQLRNEKHFRAFWEAQAPMLRGFADITLVLLHELGHVATRNDTYVEEDGEEYDREFALMMLGLFPQEVARECYFDLPDERGATEWAINWLSNPEHRKMAKAFEKKFFSCFE